MIIDKTVIIFFMNTTTQDVRNQWELTYHVTVLARIPNYPIIISRVWPISLLWSPSVNHLDHVTNNKFETKDDNMYVFG